MVFFFCTSDQLTRCSACAPTVAHLSQHDNIRLPLTPSVDMHNSWAEWTGFLLVTLRQETYNINRSVVDQVQIVKCPKTHLETYTNSSLSQLGRFGKTRKSDSLPLTTRVLGHM